MGRRGRKGSVGRVGVIKHNIFKSENFAEKPVRLYN